MGKRVKPKPLEKKSRAVKKNLAAPLPASIIKAASSERSMMSLKESMLPPKLTEKEMVAEAKEAIGEVEKEDNAIVSKLKGFASKFNERIKKKEEVLLERELKTKIHKIEEKSKGKKKISKEEAKRGIIKSVFQLLNPQKALRDGIGRLKSPVGAAKRKKKKQPAKKKSMVTRAGYSSAHKKLVVLKEKEEVAKKERARREENKLVKSIKEEEELIIEIYTLLEKLAIASAYRKLEEAKKIYSSIQKKFKALSVHGKEQAKPIIEAAMASINSLKK
ncbi:MAG: hypothetical protein ABIB71_05650 [Candidatus Woesearchaeota archaeon]